VLELYEPHLGKVLDDADASIVTPVDPFQSKTAKLVSLHERDGLCTSPLNKTFCYLFTQIGCLFEMIIHTYLS
jgi:hypothetical protein